MPHEVSKIVFVVKGFISALLVVGVWGFPVEIESIPNSAFRSPNVHSRGPDPSLLNSNNLTCSFTRGFNVWGFDLSHLTVKDQGECCLACFNNPNCVALVIVANTECYLKSNASSVYPTTQDTLTSVLRDIRLVHQGGSYGQWETDVAGLPVYNYTHNQHLDPNTTTPDPSKRTSSDPPAADDTARGGKENTFQLGNNRVVVLGNNYGAFRVRQDEGGPKFLTDSNTDNPEGINHGGGFGYLYEGTPGATTAIPQQAPFRQPQQQQQQQSPQLQQRSTSQLPPKPVLSTFYSGKPSQQARSFGVGYAITTDSNENYTVTHYLSVPFGDEAAVLVEVEIENHKSEAQTVTWAEVWDTNTVQLTFDSLFDLAKAEQEQKQPSQSPSRHHHHKQPPLHQAYKPHKPYKSSKAEGKADKAEATTKTEQQRRRRGVQDPAPTRRSLEDLTDRRAFARSHYVSGFYSVDNLLFGNTVIQARNFTGLTKDEQQFIKRSFKGNPNLPSGASLWDTDPVSVFLSDLTSIATAQQSTTTFANDAFAFFGPGGVHAPAGTLKVAPHVVEGNTTLTAATTVTIAAGDKVSLRYLFGFVTAGEEATDIPALVASAQIRFALGLIQSVTSEWDSHIVHFHMPSRPYLEAEMLWHSYYLQGGVTFDSFYGEHIIDQGTFYRYSKGFQGAMRDPLQHVLPLITLQPDIAKSVIRYVIKNMQASFYAVDSSNPSNLPWGITGHGVVVPNDYFPDDLDIFLFLAVSEYVLVTKDVEFLTEQIQIYNSTESHTVLAALQRSLEFMVDVVGLGPHNLIRLMTSDWDDSFHPSKSQVNVSESVLTSAMAAYVLPRIAEVFTLAGDIENATKAETFADTVSEAILEHAWNGEWLNRAWLGKDQGWVGGKTGSRAGVFSSPLGWAMMADLFKKNQTQTEKVVKNLLVHCRDGWPYGFAYECDVSNDTASSGALRSSAQRNLSATAGPPAPPPVVLPTSTAAAATRQTLRLARKSDHPDPKTALRSQAESFAAAGMWPALNHPTIIGLVKSNQVEVAWEEFERNSLQWQATVTPATWIGLWTSADMVQVDGMPGVWTNPFPALCMHRHGYPLVSLPALLGFSFSRAGMTFSPAIPRRLGKYHYRTSMLEVAFDGDKKWTVLYKPLSPGRIDLHFDMGKAHESEQNQQNDNHLASHTTNSPPFPSHQFGLKIAVEGVTNGGQVQKWTKLFRSLRAWFTPKAGTLHKSITFSVELVELSPHQKQV
mmetsp:Transcript_8216/g.15678  ORF Transcript_8216/g.15678 Transcript_8216/m.15678 type:complete len:1239 (-) Transcript_8216:96-3812(-)